MFLVERARRLIADLARAGILGTPAIGRALARAPRFQNIVYPLALPPLLVERAAVDRIRRDTERYVALLEKILGLYRSNAAVRAFFGLDGAADELIGAEGEVAPAIRVCRLDGYVDPGGRLRILENNADCPAGTLFTPRLNRLVRELIAPVLDAAPALPMDDGDPFTETLLRGCPQRDGPSCAVVLQPRGRANAESHEVARVLHGRGRCCAVVDPRDLVLTGDGLVWDGRRVDLVWNKINMSAWTGLVAEAPRVVSVLANAASHPVAPRMLNSFAARHVAETKTCLALLHDPRFQECFDRAERALIARLVPWTVRLDRDAVAAFDGREWLLPDLVAERRRELVLKQRYDIRGDGVTIGAAVDGHEWAAAVRSSWNSGAVIQRYVRPPRYPIVRDGERDPRDLNVSLDSFVFDGRLVGLGAKASAGAKVNLFQGGSKLAVMGVAPS